MRTMTYGEILALYESAGGAFQTMVHEMGEMGGYVFLQKMNALNRQLRNNTTIEDDVERERANAELLAQEVEIPNIYKGD